MNFEKVLSVHRLQKVWTHRVTDSFKIMLWGHPLMYVMKLQDEGCLTKRKIQFFFAVPPIVFFFDRHHAPQMINGHPLSLNRPPQLHSNSSLVFCVPQVCAYARVGGMKGSTSKLKGTYKGCNGGHVWKARLQDNQSKSHFTGSDMRPVGNTRKWTKLGLFPASHFWRQIH